jgi:hypothetical protein
MAAFKKNHHRDNNYDNQQMDTQALVEGEGGKTVQERLQESWMAQDPGGGNPDVIRRVLACKRSKKTHEAT